MNVDNWVRLLALPPVELTEGQLVGLHRMVDEWGSTAELDAVEGGQGDRVHRRYVRRTIAQDIRRARPSLAPLLVELRTSNDPVRSAIEFYSAQPSPARYIRGLADLGRFWGEWWRHPDDERYRDNLEAVSQLVTEVVGRRDVRELVGDAMMTG